MKRTGIFALAAACALGSTALVGGVAYASALNVGDAPGETLNISGVSTIPPSNPELAASSTIPSAGATATSELEVPAPEVPADDGSADADDVDAAPPAPSVDDVDTDSGVDEVTPPKPDMIGKVSKHCGKGKARDDRTAVAGDTATRPSETDASDASKAPASEPRRDHDSTKDSGARHTHEHGDQTRTDPRTEGRTDGSRDGSRHGGDRGDRSDRGGDRDRSGWGGGRSGGHGGGRH